MRNYTNGIITLILFALVFAIIWRLDSNGWSSLVWFAGTLAIVIIRAPFAKQNAANTVTFSQKDRFENLTLAGMTLSMMLLPMLYLLTDLLHFANYTLPLWATVLGAIILVPALYLFWRSHVDLGRNWSVTLEMREGHELVSSGVYSSIRHPMYTALWLIAITQPLLLHNGIAGPIVILCFAILYFIRIPREEAMMRRQFGAEYDAYRQKTKRLIPGIL